MPVWGWIAIVAGGWLTVSVAVGFLLARMFGTIERTSVATFDEWASKPLTREMRGVPTRAAARSRQPR
jgi:hypothetical protein